MDWFDWYEAIGFYFGALAIPGLLLFWICEGRQRAQAWWALAMAALAAAPVLAGFPAEHVLPAAGIGYLIGVWGIDELA